jgi:phosphopantothenoylcysteine decarboxylase/phosphopantothenate--cysteine ligase
MNTLANKKIILGVCGGIAAYKSAELVRRLVEVGAQVQVVMSAHAQSFVSALTFQALSGRAVRHSLFDETAEAAMGHIELARWADVILIAPATANTIAKLAHGLADNLLTTLCLASRAPIAVAPAMNQAMWENSTTQHNMQLLKTQHFALFGPGVGEQACGETGAGRMLEPLEIRSLLEALCSKKTQLLSGKQVLLTAGPTQEAIDPVRYISNHSSGKMGFALAEAARNAGAEVVLVCGPTKLSPPPGIEVCRVKSAEEMLAKVLKHSMASDIFISVAAVADFRLKEVKAEKIKKSADEMTLTLVKNPDILATVAKLETLRPFCVGFAAETNNLSQYAQQKLKLKNLDMIAANLVSTENNVFNNDHNALEVYTRKGDHISLGNTTKTALAKQLIELIAAQLTP